MVVCAIFMAALVAFAPTKARVNHRIVDGATNAMLDADLVDALRQAVQRNFNGGGGGGVPTYIYVHHGSGGGERRARDYFDDLLTALLPHCGCHTLYVQRAAAYRPHAHNALLLAEDVGALAAIYAGLRQYRTRNLARTLIYVRALYAVAAPELNTALHALWHMSVLDVGIVMAPSLLWITYFPYEAHACGSTRAVVHNRYERRRGEWLHGDFYPPKLRNFHGCTLVGAAWPDVPYFSVRADGSYAGLEGELVHFAAQTLNFSVTLRLLNLHRLLEGGGGGGGGSARAGMRRLSELLERRVDFAVASLPNQQPQQLHGLYTQTFYYFMSHVHLVTNVVAPAYSAYEKLAYPFAPPLWRMLAALLAVVASGVLVATHCCRRRCPRRRTLTPLYELHVLALGGACGERWLPRRSSGRQLLTAWLLGALVLRAAYQSGMYELLRNDRHRQPPHTIAGVLSDPAANYTLLLAPASLRYLGQLPPVAAQRVRLLNDSDGGGGGGGSGSELSAFRTQLLDAREPRAVLTPYEYFGHFRLRDRRSHALHVVRERIFSQQLSLCVRHNSYLVDVLNGRIRLAQTHGFVQIWKRRNMEDSNIDVTGGLVGGGGGVTNSQLVEAAAAATEQRSRNVLTMRELRAIFMILCWLHVAAVGVFIVELAWRRWAPHALRHLTFSS